VSEVHTEATPEPTGPGTAEAAQAALVESAKPATILTEAPAVVEAPAAFDPEKITFPDGFTRDNESFGKFSEIAKAANLPLPVAQQLTDLYAQVSKAESEKNSSTWRTTLTGWETEVKADREIGGSNLDSVKTTVAKVLDNPALTDPKFREALEFSGLGSNPATIRTLFRWAKALTEGSAVQAGGPSPNVGKPAAQPRSAAAALYPNLAQTER
jgi:hypothetical protein